MEEPLPNIQPFSCAGTVVKGDAKPSVMMWDDEIA